MADVATPVAQMSIEELKTLVVQNTALTCKTIKAIKAGLSMQSAFALAMDPEVQAAVETDIADAKDLPGMLQCITDVPTIIVILPLVIQGIKDIYAASKA